MTTYPNQRVRVQVEDLKQTKIAPLGQQTRAGHSLPSLTVLRFYAQIQQYLAQIAWADKAGGYAVQMSGGLIVQKIDGCYYNVKGLPINTVEHLLSHFNLALWEHL